jgi:type I restriction enzyme S subunit
MTVLAALAPRRAVVLEWKDLNPWVPPPGFGLASLAAPGRQKVTIASLTEATGEREVVRPDRDYKMAGVRWYGEGVFHRETARGDQLSAKFLTRLVPGALIYNRLFAWKGAFAVVPETLNECFVSSEFPQFVTTTEAIPEYLQLFFTRPVVMAAVASASTGSAAVSRNRFREDQFTRFVISLPTVPEQEMLVQRWRGAQQASALARTRAQRAAQEAQDSFFEDLGIVVPEVLPTPRPLVVTWSDVERWGVDFNARRKAQADLSGGRFPFASLGRLATMVQYGTSAKANTTGEGTPVIRMGNLVDGRLDLDELKFAPLPDAERDRLLLREGDVLFNRTNSKELVGKCAVFHESGDYVFASYLIRLQFDSSVVDPDFVAYVMNSPIGRRQIDALSRQIIGQANINAQEIRSLETPLPPRSVQDRLMAGVRAASARATKELRAADEFLASENTALEAAVLGILSV